MTAKTETTTDRTGLVPTAVYLALDVADKGNAAALGVLQDVRSELRTAIDSTLDLAENVTKGFFRLGHKITQRIDDAAGETLNTAERLIGSAVRTARDSTRAAAELASSATAGVVGGGASSPSIRA
jgi:hypothetical protein